MAVPARALDGRGAQPPPPPTGSFASNSFQAFYAVNCLDHDDAVPAKNLQRHEARFEKAARRYGLQQSKFRLRTDLFQPPEGDQLRLL